MKKNIADAKILETVLDYYGDEGKHWSQGSWEDGTGRCIMGAVDYAANTNVARALQTGGTRLEERVAQKLTRIVGALHEAIVKLFPSRALSYSKDPNLYFEKWEIIVHFNDTYRTNWADMQQVIKEAAFELRYGDE